MVGDWKVVAWGLSKALRRASGIIGKLAKKFKRASLGLAVNSLFSGSYDQRSVHFWRLAATLLLSLFAFRIESPLVRCASPPGLFSAFGRSGYLFDHVSQFREAVSDVASLIAEPLTDDDQVAFAGNPAAER